MIANASFRWKIIYGTIVVILLFPLYYISRPSVREPNGQLSEGGVLARLRREHELSQADIGQIDPASESMKLATLGMRGIAANLLWSKANDFKMKHDWDNLSATLNQLSKLQPNYISVWQFQGWNLAYNVSVEFDDYRSRYHWVKRGIDFLQEGIRYNSQEPVLPWEVGWTFGHKIGKADEYVQFRRLFAEDEDFHAELAADVPLDDTLGPTNKPDNWLVGREWFLLGQQLVDRGIPIRGRLVDDTGRIRRGKNPLIFHSHPPRWLINYAVAIEEEGFLDEKAQFAWMRANRQWEAYGNRPIMTSFGFPIRLTDLARRQQEAEEVGREIDELLPGVREEIEAEKRAAQPPEDLAVLDIPPEQRSVSQQELAYAVELRTRARFPEIAERAPAELRDRANRLVIIGQALREMIDAIYNYRGQVNYDYWLLRCQVEQTDTAIRARRLVFEAQEAFEQTDLEVMRVKYEGAWDAWAEIFEQHPILMEDTTAEDLMEGVRRYAWVINQMDEPWPPEGFKLKKLLEIHSLEEEY